MSNVCSSSPNGSGRRFLCVRILKNVTKKVYFTIEYYLTLKCWMNWFIV